MANASAIAVHAPSGSGGTVALAKSTFDTGTDPVTVSAAVGGDSERVVFIVEPAATYAVTFSIAAGDNPPAIKASQGALSKTGITSSAPAIIGPVISARYIQDDGSLTITLTPNTSAAISCSVTCIKLPTT